MANKKMMPAMVLMILMFFAIVISATFAWQGIGMHNEVSVEEAKFHTLQDDYFSLSKQTRDSAVTNSNLNAQLVEIQNYPSELLRLKLVGVGKILSGIFILLLGILIALMTMPMRLSMAMKK